MIRLAVLVLALTACDPIWGVEARVRDPADHPVDNVTVAIACGEGFRLGSGVVSHTLRDGTVHLGGLGTVFPPGCDVFVAKPGYRTHRIRYRDLCPGGPSGCTRVFSFDLVLEPELRP